MKYTLGGGRGGAENAHMAASASFNGDNRGEEAGSRQEKDCRPGAGAGAGAGGEERVDPSRALCVDPGPGMAGTAAAARHCAHLIQFQGEGRHCRHQRGQLGLVIALFVFLHRHK